MTCCPDRRIRLSRFRHGLPARVRVGSKLAAMLIAGMMLLSVSSAYAQNMNLSGGGGAIIIDAKEGIEWQQENLVFVARGDAVARRGEVTIKAGELRAYYRELADGSTDIWRLDAVGDVSISSPGETAYGEQAVYDVDNSILIVSGGNRVRMVTSDAEITAGKQLEYWEKKNMAVARGKATVRQQGRTLQADILTAHFRRGKGGATTVHRMEAFDAVKIVTENETVTSNRGVYNVESGVATLTGSVMIVRGKNRLQGCRATVNLKSGVSKLFACDPASGGGRVRGLIQRDTGNKK